MNNKQDVQVCDATEDGERTNSLFNKKEKFFYKQKFKSPFRPARLSVVQAGI